MCPAGSRRAAGEHTRRNTASCNDKPARRWARELSAPGQLPIGDAVRSCRVGTEPLDLVLFIRLKVALEPEPAGPTFPGEDVGRDAVEEPPVVARDHGAAWELQQR